MTQQINGTQGLTERIAVRSPPTTAAQPRNAAASQEADTRGADTVSLTATSLLKSAGSDIDTEKVARIRADLEAGRYELDPEKIAEKLLSFESQLGGDAS